MPLNPAAIGIIFNNDKTEVLLVKRKDIPIWVLPGGGIDPHETAEEAVMREVNEETGFAVMIERKSGEYTPINRLASFTSVFICKICSGAKQLTSETSEIAFHPLKQLPELFFPIHKQWLDDAIFHKECVRKPIKGTSYFSVLKLLGRHPLYLMRYFFLRLFQ